MKDREDLRIHRRDMQSFLSHPQARMPPCLFICCALSLAHLSPSSLCRAHTWNQACDTVPGPSLSFGESQCLCLHCAGVPTSDCMGAIRYHQWVGQLGQGGRNGKLAPVIPGITVNYSETWTQSCSSSDFFKRSQNPTYLMWNLPIVLFGNYNNFF